MFQITSPMNMVKLSRNYFSVLPRYLVAAFAIITILAVFVPLNPGMPRSGLDPSWVFSMNEAVAQNLKIGKEIIFTFGPYASIYTRTYHPATDHLMVLGSLFLALCYAVSLLYLAKDTKPHHLLAFLFFWAGFMYSRDVLLFSYPLILAACTSKFIAGDDQHKKANPKSWPILVIPLIFAPLGLLPLIKGSLLLISIATSLVIFLYFLYYRHCQLALVSLISPIAATTIFWVLSGQSIIYLPSFFYSMSSIISGYTEAMALQGNIKEILAYLFAAIAIIWVIVRSGEITNPTRAFLSICFAIFLFIAFKGGFVRHDGHAIMAGTSIVVAILIISLTYKDKCLMIALLISIIACVYIDKSYINTSARQIFENIRNTYVIALDGLRLRVTERDSLWNSFEHRLDEIRKEYAIPALQGTTDIYSYDQSYLLASNNKWNPRPIIQSYSVYTPKLAQINEQHLRGNNAPDNVLFRVQAIDRRLPSLEDGLSWPALFDNYTVTNLDKDLAYLRKKPTVQSSSTFDVIHEGTYKTGEDIALPLNNAPIYAEVDLKPTLLGKLVGVIFKPPQLKIKMKLKDGNIKEYRVLSNMMQSSFLISPLVQNTKDFVILATGNFRYLKGNSVETISITPTYGGSMFWSETYTLKLKAYHYRDQVATSLPVNFFESMFDFVPEGYSEAKPCNCDGSIDVVNGISPAPQKINTSSLLSVEGWLAISAKDGLVPDDIFVTLKDSNGRIRYISTQRTPRNDVKVYFKQPAMPDVGYTTTVDVTGLNGEYVLGLAIGYKSKLQRCDQFKIPLTISTGD